MVVASVLEGAWVASEVAAPFEKDGGASEVVEVVGSEVMGRG